VTAAGCGQLHGQGAEGLREDDRLAAQPDAHLAVCGLDMAEGEAADRRRSLSVEEDEQASEAVFGFEAVVVEQPAGLFPAGLGVDDAGGTAPPGGREVQAGQLVPACPADEVAGVGAVAGLSAGEPYLQVALAGGSQGKVAGGEPVEQGDGGLDVPLGGQGLAVGGMRPGQPAAQAAHDVPDGVAVQQLALARVGAFGDGPGDPGLQPGQLLIAGRQGAGGNQDRAQVPQRLAVGQFVEGGVGKRSLAGAELAQDRRGGAVAQPAQHGGGTLVAGQVVIKRLQTRPDRAVVAAEQATQLLAQLAGHAPSGGDAALLPATGAAAPEPRAGEGAGRAQRRVSGACADRRDRAAARAAGPALLACPAPGLAGGLGDHARAVLSADRAGQHFPGPAVLAQRPVGGAGADRPAPPAPGAFLLVGRVGDQAVRAQRPTVLVAGGGFPHGAAPGARLGPGLGHAVAAAPQPVDPPVKTDNPLATRAGRAGDGLRPGVAQLADQP
jgi:hypothetical protein